MKIKKVKTIIKIYETESELWFEHYLVISYLYYIIKKEVIFGLFGQIKYKYLI